MPLMQWDTNLSVGVEEIDAQHKTLVDLVNQTYEAIQGQDHALLAELVDRMAAYGRTHFATEERYMRDHGFPGIEEHKFQHAKFNATVDDFRRKLDSQTNLTQVFVFLSSWLAAHIMNEDMRYAAHMAGREN
ncbi:MAG: bacteriohemerythrin [Pseudodesulfovibrio sp.]|uniref:Hemerythrin-like metal-binding protein n=1 Tax=Pseudodesulfovibrio aespoeensis (strain ATCC 700646 / DSM 10631 / Aspo-2) TaxID=643562 RepID=E6VU57_PSEA9|nr:MULTISPECIES: bacteriohemerythrin [Pseudodesulfovibrio]MBU4193261.1 bacteriohemerythrin [Pseudomonadota bacterium]ADU62250.1 hemerythrin-like metal-binding protein [Pseudodesulfovibrio aespoeensis Aspo-2]MBU4243301.1 bacteriohemerythrin [Pseudomonadota bacterium]MBU4380376.1 bacteriohemerythrin [Pseudomonadota bacterium]MBU4476613.1 bacteriohemerythrin [Pseudomonadota bacterium]